MVPTELGLRAVLLAALAARSPASSCGLQLCLTEDGLEPATFSVLQLHSRKRRQVDMRKAGQSPPRAKVDTDRLMLMRVTSNLSASARTKSRPAVLAADSQPLCSSVTALPPLGATATVMLMALLLLRLHVARASEQQAARSIYLMVNFFLVLNYTVVILDSYDLCKRVGLSGGASGGMVGMYMLGFCGGAVGMWLLVRCRPNLWRGAPKRTLLAGLLPQLLGAFMYTWVSTQAAGRREPNFTPWRAELLSHMLIASRFVSGFGSGSCQQFYVGGMIHITPVAVRSVHTARWVFSGMLAIGLGPVLAVAMQQLHPCSRGAPHFELVGEAQIVTALGSLLAVAWLHPSLQDCDDCVESDSEDERVGEAPVAAGGQLSEHNQRRLVVCGCLCMASLRAFGVSAIEVVLAMILEETYSWKSRATGLTIGAVFLCCIPLKVVHATVGDRLSAVAWIRVLAVIALLGSGLLFASAARPLRLEELNFAGSAQLVAAAVVIFPTFYLSDALGSGLMHQHVLPTGSLLDGNHAQLWYNLMQGMGRFLGPWSGRMTVEARGQDSFAGQQMAITLVFILIFEALVRPFLTRVDGRKDAPLQQLSM